MGDFLRIFRDLPSPIGKGLSLSEQDNTNILESGKLDFLGETLHSISWYLVAASRTWIAVYKLALTGGEAEVAERISVN